MTFEPTHKWETGLFKGRSRKTNSEKALLQEIGGKRELPIFFQLHLCSEIFLTSDTFHEWEDAVDQIAAILSGISNILSIALIKHSLRSFIPSVLQLMLGQYTNSKHLPSYYIFIHSINHSLIHSFKNKQQNSWNVPGALLDVEDKEEQQSTQGTYCLVEVKNNNVPMVG